MKHFLQFIKLTLIGGLIFLVPIIALVVVLSKALSFAKAVAEPMAKLIPIDSVGRVALADILAVTAILAICFVAGLIARTSLASGFVRESENRFLWKIPGYGFFKGFVDGLTGNTEQAAMRPVIIHLDDASLLAFEIERLQDGRVVIFVPDAPSPTTGSVQLVSADRVEMLAISTIAAVQSIRQLGRGTSQFLGTESNRD